MTNYNDGNWHIWNGGECPVHPETRGDITYADGQKVRDGKLSDYTWGEALMFRVIKEHKPAREFWLVISRSGHNVMAAESEEVAKEFSRGANGRSYIHVREVTE